MSQTLQVMEELENIQQVLINCPEGASIEDIEREMIIHLPRRTLQRRLAMLKQRNIILIEGKTKNARYYVLSSEDHPFKITSESLIPLSADGLKIQKLVSLPVQKRKPIGYNRQFLESYQPNITPYLTKNDKEKLARMGNITPPPQQAGTYSKDLLSRLLVDLSWNSSRLEGNTYSLLDTQRLIAFGETADGKSTSEAQMILNHKDAIEFLTQSSPDIGFNRYTILNLHAILSNNLLPDPQAVGRLRQSGVGIAHSVFTPLAVPQIISEIFDFLLEKARLITNAHEQAFFMMVHLPYLQPFDDVNKNLNST